MKPNIRFCLLIITTLLMGMTGQLGYAQTEPDIRLESVRVNLLPEFNQPSVLVIYEINLVETLAVPQDMIFEVPANAQILTVINFTPDNKPSERPYQESSIGNWKDVRFSATSHIIRIEYQDPNLVRQGNHRRYEFQWLSFYPVTSLSMTIRQPLGASEISSEPHLDKWEDRVEGIHYYSADIGAIPADKLFTLNITYKKDPGDLAYPALPVEPAFPINESIPGRTAPPVTVILWMLLAAVAVVIVVGLYYYWFQTNIAERREHVIQGVGIMNPEKQAVFCHECGMRSRPGDIFCGNCGTELRKPVPFQQPPEG